MTHYRHGVSHAAGGGYARRPYGASGDGLLTRLTHRALVEVSGKDAGKFLQGLATADVLVPTSLAQYSLFLTPQGRVLYDTLLYHTGRESILVECDRDASTSFVKHLTRYRLRTKVSH